MAHVSPWAARLAVGLALLLLLPEPLATAAPAAEAEPVAAEAESVESVAAEAEPVAAEAEPGPAEAEPGPTGPVEQETPVVETEPSEQAVVPTPTASPSILVVPPPPGPIEVDPKHYAMVLAGNIVIGLGGVGLVAMAVGLGIRSDARTQRAGLVASGASEEVLAAQARRVETGTITAISGGVGAGVLFATGITLVALGYARERKRRLELPQVQLGPRGGGLTWTLAF